MNIYFRDKNNRLRHEHITDIEDIQSAMSMSDDNKNINPSDLVYGDERKEMRFGDG
jgi:hypothetical protein